MKLPVLKGYSKWLLVMNIIWMMPIAFYQIYNDFTDADMKSILGNFSPMLITLVASICVNDMPIINKIYNRGACCKLAIVNGVYLLNSIAVLLVNHELDKLNIINDGGGGSYLLLLLPTIAIYAIFSILVLLTCYVFNSFRKKP